MRGIITAVIADLGLAAVPLQAQSSDPAARAVVERAVAAHGGDLWLEPATLELVGTATFSDPATGAVRSEADDYRMWRTFEEGRTAAHEASGKVRIIARSDDKMIFEVGYDGETDRFSLSPEQALVFAEEDSPAFFAGAFEVVQSMWVDEPKVTEAFRTGAGLGWHEHSNCLFRGTERFFRTGYNAHLVNEWIPAIAGMAMAIGALAPAPADNARAAQDRH